MNKLAEKIFDTDAYLYSSLFFYPELRRVSGDQDEKVSGKRKNRRSVAEKGKGPLSAEKKEKRKKEAAAGPEDNKKDGRG